MSDPARTRRLGVRLLAAQAFAFGLMCALLLIPGNAIFLSAYGSRWLPVTYIIVAVLGTLMSGAIAQAVRRHPLPRVGAAVLGACAASFAATWVLLAAADATWTSWYLVTMFAIELQIGFVFIGGQAGLMFDVHEIKALFPRIVAGFPFGFLVGGLIGPPLLALSGAPEHLLVATTAATVAFAGLVVVTGRLVPATAVAPVESAGAGAGSAAGSAAGAGAGSAAGAGAGAGAGVAVEEARPPLRTLFSGRFVLLVGGYQVLSAIGSQVLDFLVFDRAAARYADADALARFVSWYTVGLNGVDIVVLALLAGAVMRRYGLKLGLQANPIVIAVLVAATAAALVGSGAASLGVFSFVVAGRILDISLSDATTRTSIAATYQVIPPAERVAVQAGVEGVGVPVAIGLTGVLLLVVDALGLGVGAVVWMGLVICAAWTMTAVLTYRDYGRALAERLHRRTDPVEVRLDDERDLAAAHALLRRDDAAGIRLGLELLGVAGDAAPERELARLADHPDPEVRLVALAAAASSGSSGPGAARLLAEAGRVARDGTAPVRAAAARALAAAPAVDSRSLLATFLGDADPEVRRAALTAVDARHAAHAALLPTVLAACDDPATASAAAQAVRRSGDAALARVGADLAAAAAPVPAGLLRRLRCLGPEDGGAAATHLGPLLDHGDRAAGLAAARVLASVPGVAGRLGPEVDRFLEDVADHDAAAAEALGALGPGRGVADGVLARALADERRLARDRAAAGLAIAFGPAAVDDVVLGLHSGDAGRRALAAELLAVTAGRVRAARLLPVLTAESAAGGDGSAGVGAAAEDVCRQLAEDRDGRWRSPWLQACALLALEASDPGLAATVASARLDALDAVLAETARRVSTPA